MLATRRVGMLWALLSCLLMPMLVAPVAVCDDALSASDWQTAAAEPEAGTGASSDDSAPIIQEERIGKPADSPTEDPVEDPVETSAETSTETPANAEEDSTGVWKHVKPLTPAEGVPQDILTLKPGDPGTAQLRFATDIDLDTLYHALERMPQRGEITMTLYDCIAMALVSNQDVLVQSFEPLKSDGDLLQAKGEFDPQFVALGSYNFSESAPSSQTTSFLGGSLSSLGGGGGGLSSLMGGGSGSSGLLGGLGGGQGLAGLIDSSQYPIAAAAAQLGSTVFSNRMKILKMLIADDEGMTLQNKQQQYQAGFQGKLHWGTTYELKLDINEEKSTFNQFVPEWSGGLRFSLTQPMLKGRGKKANLARVRRLKLARESAEYQVEQQVMNSIAEVIKAYWDLVGAVEEMEVREESLENAERLQEINARRLELGVGAAFDVVQSKAGVASRLTDLISAKSQVADAEDRLKKLIDLRDEDLISPVKVIPIDRPNLTEDIELSEEGSFTRALDLRPEIKMALVEVESTEVERKRAANDMLPKMDVSGSYSHGGRGPKTRSVFKGIEREWDKTWSVSLDGSIPLPNRLGRGTYHTALMSKRQAEQRVEKAKSDIAANVRMSIRSVATSRTLIESNRQTVALQTTNVEAEQKRLRLGLTTTYDVLKIQEDLATAQTQEVKAIINFQKALTDLQLAEGSVLGEYGIEFEAPEPEEPIGFLRSITPVTPED